MRQLKRCLDQIDFLNICQFSFQIVLKIKQGYNRNISKLIIFTFRNRIIFWDIPKQNRGQTNWDGGSNNDNKICHRGSNHNKKDVSVSYLMIVISNHTFPLFNYKESKNKV